MLEPLHFGRADRRLFGIFHGAAGVPGPTAVVLCNAFGQEAIRSHRALRVLAERLARAGHPVLRFDYYGTGDSMGDDNDGELDGWVLDLMAADAELRARCGASHTVWLGMRLGAAIALRAASQAPPGLERLVLWDPVLDGPHYLEHLRQRHVASLERAYSIVPTPAPAVQAQDSACFRDEAIGFALGPLLREQLAALTLESHRWPARPASIVALTDPEGADGRHLAAARAREAERVDVVEHRHGIDWTADTADNTALVPAQALSHLLKIVSTAA